MAIDTTTRIYVTSPSQTTGKLDGTEHATTLGELLDANEFDSAERDDFTNELQYSGEFRVGGGAAAFFINRVIGQHVSVEQGAMGLTGVVVEGTWNHTTGAYDLDAPFTLRLDDAEGECLVRLAPWACDVTVLDD